MGRHVQSKIALNKLMIMTISVSMVNGFLDANFLTDTITSETAGTTNVISQLEILGNLTLEALDVFLPTPRPIPDLPQDACWGEDCSLDASIKSFQVYFKDKMIKDLRDRLNNRRPLLPSLYNSTHTYGINTQILEKTLNYWTNDYDFKAREKYLNVFPQYITKIQGLDMHYIHVIPNSKKRTLPILLIHGSPVTAFEFRNTIKFLQTPYGDCDFDLEVVATDIPGYGYSERTNIKGLTGYQVAIIMKNLMERLGHKKFFVHAGDVGHTIGTSLFVVKPQYEDQVYSLSTLINYLKFLFANTGYFHLYVTRPDQVGIGLDESPVALAAWILHLFIVGSEGREMNLEKLNTLENNYNIDDLIDSLTIYWEQRCATSSGRFYAEAMNILDPVVSNIMLSEIKVPFAAIHFKSEIVYQPDDLLKDTFPNLVQSITLDHGGHFAGFINPQDLAESIRSAIPKMEFFNSRG